MKALTSSKGYTLVAGEDLIFPKSSGRNSLFIVNTSSNDILVALGENPADEDFFPVLSDNGHFAPIPTPSTRITFRGEGAIVLMTDAHRQLDDVIPVFKSQPESMKVEYDADAVLTVNVENEDGITFQWFRDNVEVGTDSSSYTVDSVVEPTHVSVSVSNQSGLTVSSQTAVVTPRYVHPVITSQPDSVVVASGSNAAFSVAVESSHPVSYQWYKGSEEVGTDSASLSIAVVIADDKSEYSCRISDGYNVVDSRQATANVGYQLGDRNGVEGDFTFVSGLGTAPGLGNRATFSPDGSHVGGVILGGFPGVGTIFENRETGDTLRVSSDMINDGYPGSEGGVNSSTFGIYAEPSQETIDNCGYPNILFIR